MSKLGKRLINAAKSVEAIAKGEADPKTYGVHVPANLDVRAIRTKPTLGDVRSSVAIEGKASHRGYQRALFRGN
jgi:hypothetical protein